MESANVFSLRGVPPGCDEGAPRTLASAVAGRLLDKIHADGLALGARLPSEHAMAEQFGVSRTVIRESIALLKVEGLLQTRKGSGTFVRQAESTQPKRGNWLAEESIQALLNVIEVRRGIEAETAALAAVRRTPGQLAEIEHARRRIEEAAAAGEDAVEQDARFHQCIASATGNPYWGRLIEMFAHSIRSAVKITRANEARRADFAEQVKAEHERIVEAIAAGNAEMARKAAAEHMEHAARRLREADYDFWRGEGGEFARSLGR